MMNREKSREQNTSKPLWRKIAGVLLVAVLIAAFLMTGCGQNGQEGQESSGQGGSRSGTPEPAVTVEKDGVYDSRDEVALYLHLYGELPDNYITKKEARALGWNGGGLDRYAEGKCIGGDRFGNREKRLPSDHGIRYYECDIDTLGRDSRGAKRIIYSDEGDIYYTADHYETFTKLYDKDGAA